MAVWLLVLFVLVAIMAYEYLRLKHYVFWKRKGVFSTYPRLYPLGDVWPYVLQRRSFGETVALLYRRMHPHVVAGVFLRKKPALLVRDPDLLSRVLSKDFKNFSNRYTGQEYHSRRVHDLMLMAGDSEWANLRVRLQPLMTNSGLDAAFPSLAPVSRDFLLALDDVANSGGITDLHALLKRYVTDVAASTIFGRGCKSLINHKVDFGRWVKDIHHPHSQYHFAHLTRDTVNYRLSYKITGNDLLQQMINKLQTDGAGGLTDDEIADQTASFLEASVDNITATLSFCLHELAVNSDIQETLIENIDAALASNNGTLTYNGVLNIPFLDQIIAETLRKYPPTEVIYRECTQDYRMPGTGIDIPKGTIVLISVLGIHHDPQFYPDPSRFDPQRFSPKEITKRKNFVYLPFGEGPRICFGEKFAQMVIRNCLVALLSHFDVRVCYKTKLPLIMDPRSSTRAPLGGAWLKISRR